MAHGNVFADAERHGVLLRNHSNVSGLKAGARLRLGARQALMIKAVYALTISVAVYFRVHVVIYPFLLSALLAAAFLWGEWEERLAFGAFMVTVEILAVGPHFGLFARTFDVNESRTGIVIVGAAYLVILLAIAVHSEKWWPSWVASFQALLVSSHPLFVMMHEVIEPWAYASSVVIWTWLQLIAISFGIFDAWRASRRPSFAFALVP